MPFHVPLDSWGVVTQLSPLANVCEPVQPAEPARRHETLLMPGRFKVVQF